jgi:hypothetical protein
MRRFMPLLALCVPLLAVGSGPAMAAPHAMALPAPGLATTRVDFNFGAAADDTDFLFRLGMLEGHLIIGHELLKAHQQALALPHFGHPVRELYDDFSDYLQQKHFPAFDKQLSALEQAVATAPDSPDTEAQYQSVIAIIHKARETTPADLRASIPAQIRICADTIDAASGEFGESMDHGRIVNLVEYHDSKGYLAWVAQELEDLRASHPGPDSQALLDKFKAVLAKAEWIVDPLLPGPTPRASVGTYRSFASEAAALTK